MEFVDLFLNNATGVEFGPLLSPPIVLGGPEVKHISTSFKLYGDFTYQPWAEKAVINLAGTVQRFPGPIHMWRMPVPPDGFCESYTMWLTSKVCIREVRRKLPETWTEPAEDVDPADFTPRFVHPECEEVRFDMVFKFQLPESYHAKIKD